MSLRQNEEKSRREGCFFEATNEGFQSKVCHEFRFPIPLPTVSCCSPAIMTTLPRVGRLGLSTLAYGADDAIPQRGITELRFGATQDEPAVGHNSHNSGIHDMLRAPGPGH